MKKLFGLIIVLVLASLAFVMIAYAQDGNAVVTNSETDPEAPGAEAIVVIDPSVSPPDDKQPVLPDEPAQVEEGKQLQWNEDANGTVDFPAGQQILIGLERELATMPPSYVTQFSFDTLSDTATEDTEITLISGCLVVEVSSDDLNTFVVDFLNEGQTSVHIQPPPEPVEPPPSITQVLVCVRSDGGVYVERVSGDSVIQILSGDEVVVSDVGDSAGANPDGTIEVTPSGVGNASS